MPATPVIAVFDIGKTNKKLFLFNESYRIVYEESVCFAEITDEDGDPCEDIQHLQEFVFSSLQTVSKNKAFLIKAVNFSTYGASFVHLDKAGQPVTPLYNYLKEYPPDLLKLFYNSYGGEPLFSVTTSSPVLGHLNSGLQIYWLKHQKPHLFQKIHCSLHLPQYMSYLLTGQCVSDVTSIGCHTNLWDFSKGDYHEWVHREGIMEKLAPVVDSTEVMNPLVAGNQFKVGAGLHDSSAALIPYLASFQEPFVLLSTGTWCISLNPFNQTPLTFPELQQDCLCYLTYEGKPVKASRLFAGHEHEEQVKRLAAHYQKPADFYKTIQPDVELLAAAQHTAPENIPSVTGSSFAEQHLSAFPTYEVAYHHLMQHIMARQVRSTQLVLKGTPVKRIFVDGGFGKNPLYMHLLAAAFPGKEVYAASVAQASAMGTALAIHRHWNSQHLPTDIIELKFYGTAQEWRQKKPEN